MATHDRAADEIDFRYRMAKSLGYGPTGPKNIQQLTHAELRVFAEGMRREAEREAKQWQGEDANGKPRRAKGQPRDSDHEMVKNVQQDMENAGMAD